MMEDTFKKSDELFRDLKEYISKRLLLFELNLADKLSKIISKWIVSILIVTMFFFGLVFISASVAFFIGKLMGDVFYGFLIVGISYWIAAVNLWKTKRRKMQKSILNSLLENFISYE